MTVWDFQKWQLIWGVSQFWLFSKNTEQVVAEPRQLDSQIPLELLAILCSLAKSQSRERENTAYKHLMNLNASGRKYFQSSSAMKSICRLMPVKSVVLLLTLYEYSCRKEA